MSDDRIRMGVIVEGGSAPEWYWRQQIEAIEQERDALKAKLAEVEAERDALRVVELPDPEGAFNRCADFPSDRRSLLEYRLFSFDEDNFPIWNIFAEDFIALINKERGL